MKVLVCSLICNFILIGAESCVGGYVDANVTQAKIRELTGMLERGDTNFLEAASKVKELSSLSTLMDSLTKDTTFSDEEATANLEVELDKLSEKSPMIEQEKKKLLTAAQQYIKLNKPPHRISDSETVMTKSIESLPHSTEEEEAKKEEVIVSSVAEEGIEGSMAQVNVEVVEVVDGKEKKSDKARELTVEVAKALTQNDVGAVFTRLLELQTESLKKSKGEGQTAITNDPGALALEDN